MALGNRIRTRRLQLSITQKELGELCGVSEATINRYESGNIKNPSLAIVQSLATALRVDPNYLLRSEDDNRYFNPETQALAEELHHNPELALLFSAARDASPEDLKTVHDMLKLLKQRERYEID